MTDLVERCSYTVGGPGVVASGRCALSTSADDAVWMHVQKTTEPGLYCGQVIDDDGRLIDHVLLEVSRVRRSVLDIQTKAGMWVSEVRP